MSFIDITICLITEKGKHDFFELREMSASLLM